jgi:hypothetical protein
MKWFAIFLVYLLPNYLTGQHRTLEELELKRLDGNIVLDGMITEPAWEAIKPLPLVVHQPNFGSSPSLHSEIRVGYDEEFIYVSGCLFDDEPEEILATSKKRDAMTANTDWIGIVLDTYNDKENALAFFTNPNGLRLDVNVFNDAIGQFPINLSWNAFWDVETQITPEGWFVEMRIPFTSLAYQESDGVVKMGMIVWRWVARKYESYIFPAIPPDWGDWSSWKPSQAHEISMTEIRRRKPFYLAPYLLAGHQSGTSLDEPELNYVTDHDLIGEVGLDLKFGLTNNITMDVSVNTDFAQVEADDQQINLTRFSLFFPEKRLFFQERAGIFNYNFGNEDKLFHSRRIGIREEEMVGIYGGVRVVGRAGKWDFGFLDMQTESFVTEDGEALNSENYGVLRIRKNFLNQGSFFGALVTNRMDFRGDYNSTYGFDMNLQYGPSDYLEVRLAQTFADGNGNQPVSLDPTRLWISASNRSDRGFTYGLSLSRSGVDFDPVMGFHPRENFTRVGTRLGYGWYQDEESALFKHVLTAKNVLHVSNEFREIESYSSNLNWTLNWKSGFIAGITAEYNYDRIYEDFELTDRVDITPGEYNYWKGAVSLNSSFARPFYIMSTFSLGSLYGGNLHGAEINPVFNASASLELNGTYVYNRLKFESPDLLENLHILRLKALFMFSTEFSISSFIQFNSLDSALLTNLRIRYNPREGVDLYLVVNEDFNTSRNNTYPSLPLIDRGSIQIKYTHTFRL